MFFVTFIKVCSLLHSWPRIQNLVLSPIFGICSQRVEEEEEEEEEEDEEEEEEEGGGRGGGEGGGGGNKMPGARLVTAGTTPTVWRDANCLQLFRCVLLFLWKQGVREKGRLGWGKRGSR